MPPNDCSRRVRHLRIAAYILSPVSDEDDTAGGHLGGGGLAELAGARARNKLFSKNCTGKVLELIKNKPAAQAARADPSQ